MAHYAFLDNNNVVVEVITGVDECPEHDWEQIYGEMRGLRCKRTSYNTIGNQHLNGGIPFRGNFAGIGYVYIDEIDMFIPQSPFPSWLIDLDNKSWKPPINYPDDGKYYTWDESTISWVEDPNAILISDISNEIYE